MAQTSMNTEAVASSSLSTRNRIVAFVNDDISAAALRRGFEGIEQTFDVRRGNIRAAVKLLETDTHFHSVIADISAMENPIAELQHLAMVCPADVQVCLIGDNADISFYRTLVFEMGVCEYLPKPLTRDMIQTQLRPKLLGDVEAKPLDRAGHVVCVIGAQGGAGATSTAINLALQLADTTKARVALLDMHLQGGETAVMLGVQPGIGLRTALEDPQRADTLFLDRAGREVNERVRLIAGDEAPDAQLQITEAGVQHVLSLLRHSFNFVVVDTPSTLTPAIQAVVRESRHVLVLLEAEITGLHNAKALRQVIINIAGKNRVFTVLNRANRPGGLSVASIAKGLGSAEKPQLPDIIIPDLGKRMTEAVNQGIPALQRLPALRRSLAPLVREIAGITTENRSWLRRFLGR